MKKIICILFLGLLSNSMNAQLDTLLANASHNLALFFPSPIRQAVTGAGNFTFSYNREEAQYFGLLQANPGTDSNLLVLTQDGQAYSYALKYRSEISRTHRFITMGESIGTETPQKETEPRDVPEELHKVMEQDNPHRNRMEYFKKFSAYHSEHNKNSLKSKRKDGMILRLKDLVYDRTEVYAVMEIENRSKIDLELDYLEIFKVNGNKRRKSSYQKVAMLPIYEHKFPRMVKVGENKMFVYVLPKFTLGDAEKLLFSFREKWGSRMLELHIGQY